MKKYRGFSVDVVANGFIASIGCQRLVFKTMEEVSEAIMDYAKDPEGAAKKILENSFTSVIMDVERTGFNHEGPLHENQGGRGCST